MSAIILDSAMGSRLEEMGHKLTAPLWSATVLQSNPEDITRFIKRILKLELRLLPPTLFEPPHMPYIRLDYRELMHTPVLEP